ncbi:MAG: hypothetical protein SGPRY_012347, partial [Prymnesium sp.]
YTDLSVAGEGDTSSVYTSRFVIACLAVVLLWSSTLSAVTAALEASHLLRVPPSAVVIAEGARFYNETFEAEWQRSRQARDHNQRLLRSSLEAQASCSASRALAIAAMAAWDKAGGGGGVGRYKEDCPASKRDALRGLTHDVSEQKSASLLIAREYSSSSRSAVAVLSSQIEARAAYDSEYILNKTRAREAYDTLLRSIVQHSLGHVTGAIGAIDTSGLHAGKERAVEMVRIAQANVESSFDAAKQTYSETVAKAELFAYEAENKLSSAADTFAAISGWLQRNTPEIGGLSGMGFRVPGLSVSSPPFDPGLPSLDMSSSLPQRSVEQIAAAIRALEESIAAAARHASLLPSNLSLRLEALAQPDPFSDYNPPTVDAPVIMRRHVEESSLFEQSLAAQLDALQLAGASSNASSSTFALPSTGNSSSGLPEEGEEDLSWFSYKRLEDVGLDLDSLLFRVAEVAGFFSSLDLMWRVVRTISILYSFWGRSALAVPPIDMETDSYSKARNTIPPTPSLLLRIPLRLVPGASKLAATQLKLSSRHFSSYYFLPQFIAPLPTSQHCTAAQHTSPHLTSPHLI